MLEETHFIYLPQTAEVLCFIQLLHFSLLLPHIFAENEDFGLCPLSCKLK